VSILLYGRRNPRERIGFVEEEAPESAKSELEKQSGYRLYRLDESNLAAPGVLATTGAVIVQQTAGKPRRVRQLLERYAPTLLWHDCRVFVRPAPAAPGKNAPAFRQMVVDALGELKLPASGLNDDEMEGIGEKPGVRRLTPLVHVLDNSAPWREVILHLRADPAGIAPVQDLKILGPERKPISLSPPERDVLVRRAFWDCVSVQLEPRTGLSRADTFRALAHLREDNVVDASLPYQYFVKLGERPTISREYLNYRETALEHVPFHLGPRLRLDRCALGHEQGIIVCDYVDGAETLKDCAKNGRAVPVIANLFNATLRAWLDANVREERSLLDLLNEKLEQPTLRPIPSHRKKRIDDYAAKKSVEELKELLVEVDSCAQTVVGVIHGDLHATNVLVRGHDAIIIDFEKAETLGPLLWDMASLEGGLFVDGFVGDRRAGAELLNSVECMYEAKAFGITGAPRCDPSDGSAWFFDCVRQIRMHASRVECAPRQYAVALAVALERKACNPKYFPSDKKSGLTREDVRALAYVLSESILVGLQS
jgi:uncharacterized protein associated with vWA-MoxR-VMAP ternary system